MFIHARHASFCDVFCLSWWDHVGTGLILLRSGKNTGGVADIIQATEDAEYGECTLTIKYPVMTADGGLQTYLINNVTGLCMPVFKAKTIRICYIRWHPNNVDINVPEIKKDPGSETGYDVACRIIWAGSIMLIIFICFTALTIHILRLELAKWSTIDAHDDTHQIQMKDVDI